MNPEAQRIAIAEFCGWNVTEEKDIMGTFSRKRFYHPSHGGTSSIANPLPNYLNDLNAIREAENILFERGGQSNFTTHLCDTCRPNGAEPDSIDDLLEAIHATAAQRAEALLRTIGKWKDE